MKKIITTDLAPKVEQDASRQDLRLVPGLRHDDGLFQVDGPQLAEDEGVKEGAHVDHRRLALLGEPGQNHLDVVGYVARRLQRNRLASHNLAGNCNLRRHRVVVTFIFHLG